jgi:hypothetical protein
MDNKKVVGSGIRILLWLMVVIGGIIIGFVFLMRSCLSQWDTYGTIGWPGITEDQKNIVIVKSYSKINSYSNKNGVTHKSYSTTYYIEKIELVSGTVVEKKKLIHQRKIKNGSLACYGGYKNKLWIFANQLVAYDMNSLEQVIQLEDIENKNPLLQGKMPTEQHYYDAHLNLGYITITATDGDKYRIMLEDLHAELIDEEANSYKNFNAKFKKENEIIAAKIDSLNAIYRNDYKKYEQISPQRNILYAKQDSLRKMEDNARELFTAQENLLRNLEKFDPFSSNDVRDWVTMKDTLKGNAFVLSKDASEDKNFSLSDMDNFGSEDDKVKLYKLGIMPNPQSHSSYDDYIVTKTEQFNDLRFLQGGIMANYHSGGAFHTANPAGLIIFGRDIIGNKAKLLVTRIDENGKKIWQTNALMSYKINFTVATNDYLIVCGVIDQEKPPSFASGDAVRIIDLKTGSLVNVKY